MWIYIQLAGIHKKKRLKGDKVSSNIILNIPHASTVLPREDFPSPYQESGGLAYWNWGGRQKVMGEIMKRYLDELPYMTDWYTDELFVNGIGKPLIAPVSRLLCDVERLKDDMKEEMSTVGMGICYTQTHNLEILANFKFSHKLEMIRKYYDPYHQALKSYVKQAFDEHKCVLILDCHSFSNVPYNCDQNFKYGRPDICIGTAVSHTPEELTNSLTSYFQGLGYSVKLDYPFSGTIIPEGYETKFNLFSIMIEINRSLYLDMNSKDVKKKEEEFIRLKNQIHEAENIIASFVDQKCREAEKREEKIKNMKENGSESDKLLARLSDPEGYIEKVNAMKNTPKKKTDVDNEGPDKE